MCQSRCSSSPAYRNELKAQRSGRLRCRIPPNSLFVRQSHRWTRLAPIMDVRTRGPSGVPSRMEYSHSGINIACCSSDSDGRLLQFQYTMGTAHKKSSIHCPYPLRSPHFHICIHCLVYVGVEAAHIVGSIHLGHEVRVEVGGEREDIVHAVWLELQISDRLRCIESGSRGDHTCRIRRMPQSPIRTTNVAPGKSLP